MDELPSISPTAKRAPRTSQLDSAITYLRRGLRRDGTYPEVSEWDAAGHQWRSLHAWASSQALEVPLNVAPTQIGGREHDVHFDDVSRRWLKFTKLNSAGYTVELVDGRLLMLPASPLQYLERWRSYNRLFYDRTELVGLRSQGHNHQIVVSQKDWGEDNPTWEEIEGAMVGDYQMRRIFTPEALGGYEARAYIKDRFAIFDVRPVNCARSKEGVVVPFDVIPRILTQADAATLQKFSLRPP